MLLNITVTAVFIELDETRFVKNKEYNWFFFILLEIKCDLSRIMEYDLSHTTVNWCISRKKWMADKNRTRKQWYKWSVELLQQKAKHLLDL